MGFRGHDVTLRGVGPNIAQFSGIGFPALTFSHNIFALTQMIRTIDSTKYGICYVHNLQVENRAFDRLTGQIHENTLERKTQPNLKATEKIV